MATFSMDAREHGQTDGTIVTDALMLSACGLAATKVTSGGGQAFFRGTDLIEFNDPVGANAVIRFDANVFAGTSDRFSIEFKLPNGAVPDAEARYITIRNPGNTADVVRVVVNVDGEITVYDGNQNIILAFTTPLPPAGPCRVHIGGVLESSPGAADGTAQGHVYTADSGDSTTWAEEKTASGLSWNGATAIGAQVRIGSITSGAGVTQLWYYLRGSDATDAPLGPLTTPPSVNDSTQMAAYSIAGHITGGQAPYTIASATQVPGTTGVGTISIHQASLSIVFARPTVEDIEIDVVARDNLGVDSAPFRIAVPVATTPVSSGEWIWDDTIPGWS